MENMEKNIQIDSALETYVSPQVKVVKFKLEGLLCQSSGMTGKFDEEEFDWN